MRNLLRTYSELITLPTFEERLKYLRCGGTVGEYTFSFERYLNQNFYRTNLWRKIRRTVILRDNNCDLAMPDPSYDVGNYAIVHHMNPIGKQDIIDKSDMLLNPEYLITVSSATHRAIHYGGEPELIRPIEREMNDTKLW